MLYILFFVSELIFVCVSIAMIIHYVMSLFGGLRFAPFVPTTRKRVDLMIQLAQITPGMRVIELGSGKGRITIAAAQKGAIATGYEADPVLVVWSRCVAWWKKATTASFQRANIWTTVWPSEADIVFVYGLPRFMGRVWKKACLELKPGTKIISNAFRIPGVEPKHVEDAIYVYSVERLDH
ncbi:hypothetical protein IT408_01895 [Candidatus Uhrbacteria bacterium]|nr:hypothetical protein [Candidatus Uhrbacteria bacterium]